MKKLLIIALAICLFGCSNNTHKIGYYEPKKLYMDETIQQKFKSENFKLIKDGLNARQIEKLNSILVNKDFHKNSELGTCEISGVIILNDKVVYLTCGTSQIFIANNSGIQKVLLTNKADEELTRLITEFRK